MNRTGDFIVGSDVASSDGVCGKLTGVVVDPLTVSLTHLVVAPRHHREMVTRLVPVDLLDPVDTVDTMESGIRLRCSGAEFDAVEPAEERRFVSGAPGQWSYGPIGYVKGVVVHPGGGPVIHGLLEQAQPSRCPTPEEPFPPRTVRRSQ
jgi:hypothetical protein